VACLEAAGIDYASSAELRERRARSLTSPPASGRGRSGTSTWQSIARGRGSVETDFLNGEIALLGRLHGIPTPANVLLQAISADVAAGRRTAGSMSEEEFLGRASKQLAAQSVADQRVGDSRTTNAGRCGSGAANNGLGLPPTAAMARSSNTGVW
jgi:2-dehydropantoate 2-reductase